MSNSRQGACKACESAMAPPAYMSTLPSHVAIRNHDGAGGAGGAILALRIGLEDAFTSIVRYEL
jgi:hypothetical protein